MLLIGYVPKLMYGESEKDVYSFGCFNTVDEVKSFVHDYNAKVNKFNETENVEDSLTDEQEKRAEELNLVVQSKFGKKTLFKFNLGLYNYTYYRLDKPMYIATTETVNTEL